MFDYVLSSRGQGYFGLANGSTDPDSETSLSSFVPSIILDDYFDQTLAFLQSKNIPVYFIAMPHNSVSGRLYYPGLRNDFVAYLSNYAYRYSDFHILGDPFPSYPQEYFGDALHLNEKGAALWSDHVAKLLKDEHVEGGPFGSP